MIPREQILKSQELRNVVDRDGYMTMWIGNDRRLIMYPCSNNTLMNFVAIHPSNLSASKEEGKHKPQSQQRQRARLLTLDRLEPNWQQEESH